MSNLKFYEYGFEVQEVQTVRDLAILNLYDSKYQLSVDVAFAKEELQKIVDNYNFDSEDDYTKNKVLKDFEIMESIKKERAKYQNPIVGDYVLADGELKRIGISIGDSFQYGNLQASYNISKSGKASYSGGCYEAFNPNNLELTGQKPAYFWIWHNGNIGAHQSINICIPVNVWKFKN